MDIKACTHSSHMLACVLDKDLWLMNADSGEKTRLTYSHTPQTDLLSAGQSSFVSQVCVCVCACACVHASAHESVCVRACMCVYVFVRVCIIFLLFYDPPVTQITCVSYRSYVIGFI